MCLVGGGGREGVVHCNVQYSKSAQFAWGGGGRGRGVKSAVSNNDYARPLTPPNLVLYF